VSRTDCPNGCGQLTNARNKSVEFDDGKNEIEIAIFLEWCPKCHFVNNVSDDS
jgi:hypothetical protein